MDEDDIDRTVGTTVATDAISEGYLMEKSEMDGYEASGREDDYFEEELGYESESFDDDVYDEE